MLLVSMGLFILAAIGGIYLAGFQLTEKRRIAGIARAHGAFALGGMAILLASLVRGPRPPLAIAAAVLFVFVAGIGLWMRGVALRQQPVPPALVAVHAGLALIGTGLLFVAFATAE